MGFFSRLPRVTWGREAVWRRQVARACDDLRGDLEGGLWPQPRCAAEEVCLYLAIGDAEGFEDLHRDPDLPFHDDDYDWDGCVEFLYQDTDFLNFFEPSLDGFDDPESDVNTVFGSGDMRPANWFTTFDNQQARDSSRGFRR